MDSQCNRKGWAYTVATEVYSAIKSAEVELTIMCNSTQQGQMQVTGHLAT